MFNYTFIGVLWWLSGKETAFNSRDGQVQGLGDEPSGLASPVPSTCIGIWNLGPSLGEGLGGHQGLS